MTDHQNRSRSRKVELTLSPTDTRALRYVLSHLESIVADFPEQGSGQGYDAVMVRDMHRGVEIVRHLVYGA